MFCTYKGDKQLSGQACTEQCTVAASMRGVFFFHVSCRAALQLYMRNVVLQEYLTVFKYGR